jgi:hypothetical protein
MSPAGPAVRAALVGAAAIVLLAPSVAIGGRAEALARLWPASVPRPPVDVAASERVPCTRAGIAQSVIAFVGLVHGGRYAATPRLWVPKRLPTPAFFRIVRGRPIRAERPGELPAATQTWRADRFQELSVSVLNPYVSRKPRTSSGYGVAWTRTDPGDGSIRFGKGKGVWDCETRRIAQFFGQEVTITADELARETALALRSYCGRRGSRPFTRYGQTAALCNPS